MILMQELKMTGIKKRVYVHQEARYEEAGLICLSICSEGIKDPTETWRRQDQCTTRRP